MKPITLITTFLAVLFIGFYLGSGFGAGMQMRSDMAKFSEELRGMHSKLKGLESVPQGVKDGPLFTLQGIHAEQGRFIAPEVFSPARLPLLFWRPSWETAERQKNYEYLKENNALPGEYPSQGRAV